MSLESFSDDIVQKLKDGKTYAEISDHLKAMGLQRGSSEANIRKFCRELGIRILDQLGDGGDDGTEFSGGMLFICYE